MSDVEGSADTTDPAPDEPGGPPLTREEFETLVTEIHHPLTATALRLTRRRAEAEDLVQETLYRGWRAINSFRRGSRFRAWMFRILHNTFINRVRREKLAPVAVDPAEFTPRDRDHAPPSLRSIDELPDIADHHFDESVKAAVDALPETFRAPLVLFALGNLSYQEIAETLGVPVGTVMSRLHRARRRMREALADYVAGDSGTPGESGALS